MQINLDLTTAQCKLLAMDMSEQEFRDWVIDELCEIHKLIGIHKLLKEMEIENVNRN